MMVEKDISKDYWIGSNFNLPGELPLTKLSEPRVFIRYLSKTEGWSISFEEFKQNILEIIPLAGQVIDKEQIIAEAYAFIELDIMHSESFIGYFETVRNPEDSGMEMHIDDRPDITPEEIANYNPDDEPEDPES